MASSLFVNAMQVNFDSELTMEHSGMDKMFKSLEDSGLKGFLEASNLVYEEAVIEFSFSEYSKGDMIEMQSQFSGSDEPFRAPKKKKEMKIEFRLLHDVVAKALCAKSGSFDQGFAIQISVLLQNIVKENLGKSVKLHPQKVLKSKSVNTYIKKNLKIKPAGESSMHNDDTASNTEGGESQGALLVRKIGSKDQQPRI
ncbi:hypothetical protein F511_41807 [Dorcoceras hygrometricum]|uniref:Uncharacterized protein n=1 Tax=Dorcoceras hygrometricum TaxID=472368 RepID=A0A2Z7C7Y9_9LAMI|nr:hypothetical protein F511_41807 [Dorcoceras hygrometricum]